MKKLIILTFSVVLILGFGSAYGQMKPQISTQVKPSVLGKTYWCAEVQDILFSKEPQQGQKLNVGVRIKFTKKTVIPGTPGQKLCDCAFEGPSGAPVKFWSKTMSLRLIGIKYSENETNLLEYYGPTPAFPPYDYSGFQVIGFTVTENDLKKGYIDVWGWASKEPLQCREASIYASLAVYNQSPYTKQNECHPHPDFKKSFKPKCLEVPKIKKEVIEKGIRVPEVLKNLPDLKISNAEIFPKISGKENEQAVSYDEAQLKINILNSGQGDVSKFKVKVERKWEWENEYHPETGIDSRYDIGYFYGKEGEWHSIKRGSIKDGIIEVDGIQAGGYRTIWIFVDNSFAPKADCWFRIILDPDNEIAELDESNNGMSEILFPSHYKHPEKYQKNEPRKSNLPDLVVKGKRLDETGELSFTVTNKGEKDVDNSFSILIEVQQCGGSEFYSVKKLRWPGVKVGWPKTTSLKLDLPFCTSPREVRIKVDSENDVEESDEVNNTFSLIWPAEKPQSLLPDLVVESISITKKERYLDEDGLWHIRYTVAIVIANKGNADANDFDIEIQGLAIVSAGYWDIIERKKGYSLKPGNFAILTTSFSVWDEKNVTSLYRVIVDSEGRITELDESNNIKEFEVEGYSGPLTIIKGKK